MGEILDVAHEVDALCLPPSNWYVPRMCEGAYRYTLNGAFGSADECFSIALQPVLISWDLRLVLPSETRCS